MPIYYGKTEDGSDAREPFGVFINPENENEWSNKPYNKQQAQELKDHNTYWDLRNYCNGRFTLDDCYKQIKNNTFPLCKRIKDYVLSHYDDKGNFLEERKKPICKKHIYEKQEQKTENNLIFVTWKCTCGKTL